MNNSSLGILFGLVALLTNGFAGSLAKVPVKALGVNKLIFYRTVFNSLLLLIVLLFTLNQSNFSLKYVLITVAIAIFGYLPMFFFYKAMALGKVGVVSPVASANSIVAVLLSIIILKESLNGLQTISIFFIVFGVILISTNFKEFERSSLFKISSGIPYALLAALGWGIWSVLVKAPIQVLGPFFTSFIMETVGLVVAYLLICGTKEGIKIKDKSILRTVIPISIFMVIWSLAYYQGIKISNVSILVPLSSASPLIVALYGKFKYKEVLSTQQYVGIGVILLSVIMLSM